MAEMAEEIEENTIEHNLNDGGICKFLQEADLELFDSKFKAAGVTKVEHITDVTKEDLKQIGEILFVQSSV